MEGVEKKERGRACYSRESNARGRGDSRHKHSRVTNERFSPVNKNGWGPAQGDIDNRTSVSVPINALNCTSHKTVYCPGGNIQSGSREFLQQIKEHVYVVRKQSNSIHMKEPNGGDILP